VSSKWSGCFLGSLFDVAHTKGIGLTSEAKILTAFVQAGCPVLLLWVPKTYVTWADALRDAGRFRPVSGGWKAGQGMG